MSNPVNRQTDRHRWKHNLLCRSSKRWFDRVYLWLLVNDS